MDKESPDNRPFKKSEKPFVSHAVLVAAELVNAQPRQAIKKAASFNL